MKIEIQFDGSCLKEKKYSIISYAIFDLEARKLIYEEVKKIEYMGSAKTEMSALIQALNKFIELGLNDVHIKGDAQFVNHYCGLCKIKKNKKYKYIIDEILTKISTYRFTWVPRNQNQYADKLCRMLH